MSEVVPKDRKRLDPRHLLRHRMMLMAAYFPPAA
jgi:hypothetical protein